MSTDFTARIPLGRWGKPEEIGKLAVYRCSEDAGFITGTDMLIDGGWMAQYSARQACFESGLRVAY